MCYQQVLCMPPFHFRYDEKNKQFAIFIIQLSNLSALLLQQDQKV